MQCPNCCQPADPWWNYCPVCGYNGAKAHATLMKSDFLEDASKLLDDMESFAVSCDRAGNKRDASTIRSWVKQLQGCSKHKANRMDYIARSRAGKKMKTDEEISKMTPKEKDLYFCTICRGIAVNIAGEELSGRYHPECKKCKKTYVRY